MKMWLRIILLVVVCSIADSLTTVYGQYGSDLHLLLLQLCQEPFFDVRTGETLVGNYHNTILQGFNKYIDRLQFDRKNCTFIIRNFSEVDGHNFTFNNFGPTFWENFKVIILDTSDKYTSDKYTSDGCPSGILAFGLSLDSIICLVVIILAEKINEKHVNDGVACIQETDVSFLGKDKRNWKNFACIFIKVFSLVCQIISLISLVCCERIHGTDCLFITATSFTVIDWFFAAVWIYFISKYNKGNSNPIKRNQSFCYVLEAAQSLAFPAFICLLYFSQYGANSTHLVWVLVASPLISVILKIVIFILCRLKKRTTNLKEKPALDTDGLL